MYTNQKMRPRTNTEKRPSTTKWCLGEKLKILRSFSFGFWRRCSLSINSLYYHLTIPQCIRTSPSSKSHQVFINFTPRLFFISVKSESEKSFVRLGKISRFIWPTNNNNSISDANGKQQIILATGIILNTCTRHYITTKCYRFCWEIILKREKKNIETRHANPHCENCCQAKIMSKFVDICSTWI